MALTNCVECNGKVSTEASACPHCGAPVKRTAAPANPTDYENYDGSVPLPDGGTGFIGTVVVGLSVIALLVLLMSAGDRLDGNTIYALVLIAVGLAAYFAPALIATRRGHAQQNAIFVLNLFLGWTLIGWIAALVWSLTNSTRRQAEH